MSYFAPGTRLADRYQIGAELGRGGHSVVYQARDLTLGIDVAVKLLVPPPATQELARERLRREVLAVRQLVHPHIVPVYEYLTKGPWQFIVMQLVQGEDLEHRVREGGPLEPGAATSLGQSIASALALAHREGILHRDVKPRNILLDQAGTALLTDFGSARVLSQGTMTETGGLVGTLAYSAPELMAGRRADARSDTYALGLTLYYALTGRLPSQPSPHLPPPPSDHGYHPRTENRSVPDWLDAAVARATQADPADRFPTAGSFMDALGDPVQAVLPVMAWEDRCLVCGTIDVEGLTVCRRCGTMEQGSDGLIFLDPGSAEHRDDRLAQLLVWFGGSRAAGHRDVVLGLKPLARVPDGMAEAAVDRLAARGLSARAVPVRSVWRMIPFGLWALALLAVGLGMWAGRVIHPALFWSSPVFAALLLAGAASAGRLPLLDRKPRGARLSPELEREVLATAAELPAGSARELFGGLVRLVRHLAGSGIVDGRAELIGEILPLACRGARGLARLDEALALLDRDSDTAADPAARGDLGHRRDRMVQCLLETQGGLRRIIALPPAEDGVEAQLRNLVDRIEREAEAGSEVRELLRR
ncbi:MAG: protein kinase [Gemmatimonadota bacterium]|nr:protein kinase [Gemmatimonadota bacterium]